MYEMLCGYLRDNTIVCSDGERCYSPWVYTDDIIINTKVGDKILITFTYDAFKTEERITKSAELSVWDVLAYVNERINNLKLNV
jgi:hypothetical protein